MQTKETELELSILKNVISRLKSDLHARKKDMLIRSMIGSAEMIVAAKVSLIVIQL